jgi:NAD(P)-dependent dehydrogenase (short-subunit alcohol dehydrogenase family)
MTRITAGASTGAWPSHSGGVIASTSPSVCTEENQMLELSGRRIAVTGAAAGIGAAVREQLLDRGAEVIVLDRNDPGDDRVSYVPCDLADPTSIETALAQLPATLGGFANVAGLPGTHSAEAVMRVNFLGLRLLTDRVLERIDAGGAVVNVASIAGSSWPLNLEKLAALNSTEDFDSGLKWCVDNGPGDGSTAYNFSKEALIFYTKHRAVSAWKRGVRMNSVSPGATATGILGDFKASMAPGAIDWSEHLLGRHAAPEEVAPVIVFLLGPHSSFVNGADVPVDGGLVAGMTVGATQPEGSTHA